MTEVEVPYRDGPLDGERELFAEWELEEGAPGSTEGSIYERPEEWSQDWSAATTTVHRYRLTYVSKHAGWEYRYIGTAGPTDG